MSHTPTPWEYGETDDQFVLYAITESYERFPKCYTNVSEFMSEDDAKHILKCVHMHKEMVAAFEEIKDTLKTELNMSNYHEDDVSQINNECCEAYQIANDILKRATEDNITTKENKQ